MFSLLASYSILNAARALATERVTGAVAPDDPRIDDGVRKLILTEDFFVMQRVVKYVREALESLEDAELAALIAAKRLGDYKASLERRNRELSAMYEMAALLNRASTVDEMTEGFLHRVIEVAGVDGQGGGRFIGLGIADQQDPEPVCQLQIVIPPMVVGTGIWAHWGVARGEFI